VKKKTKKKPRRDKPISFFPLDYKEAVKALLQTKPPPKDHEKKKS